MITVFVLLVIYGSVLSYGLGWYYSLIEQAEYESAASLRRHLSIRAEFREAFSARYRSKS